MLKWHSSGKHRRRVAFISRVAPDVLPSKEMKLVDPRRQTKIVHSNDPSKIIRKGKPVKDAVESAFSTALFSMSENRLRQRAPVCRR